MEKSLKIKEVLKVYEVVEPMAKKSIRPINLSIRLSKVYKQCLEVVEQVDERKRELIKELGTETEKGGFEIRATDQENMQKYAQEMDSLLEEAVSFELPVIKESDFDNDFFDKVGIPSEFFTGFEPCFSTETPKSTTKKKVSRTRKSKAA